MCEACSWFARGGTQRRATVRKVHTSVAFGDLTNFLLFAGIPITDEDIANLGLVVVPMLSVEQLRAAHEHFSLHSALRPSMMVNLSTVHRAMCNHWRSCLKMPAGGANAGGSQQTGFEMELVTPRGAKELFKNWPNHQIMRRAHTWEARTMQECASLLAFEELPAGWGMGNAKPAPLTTGAKFHTAILIASPPITVTYNLHADTTSTLAVRAPITIYTEEDAMLLPPDDKEGTPFYVDPPDRPGWHRDEFRSHARRLLRSMLEAGWPLSSRLAQLCSSQ